jgi:prepilin-type N-terminal cleavage/methylation domain-containing protein
MKAMHKNQPAQAQQGFTLLELLVVVSILAAVAGIATSAVGGYNERAREELVHVEMNNIADAIYKFHTDTGYFPKTGLFGEGERDEISVGKLIYQYPETFKSEENLDFLYEQPAKCTKKSTLNDCIEDASLKTVITKLATWNSDQSIGWNGPYMARNSQQRMHFKGTDSQSNCELDELGDLSDSNSFSAIEDPFQRAVISGSDKNYESDAECFAILKTTRNKNGSDRKNIARAYAGQAYRYITNFENDLYPQCLEDSKGCIALVSFGKNGIYESDLDNPIDCSTPQACDDIVKVLRVNK